MHDAEFRARILALAAAPEANVQELARRHGLSPSLIYRWRRLSSGQAAPCAPEVRLLPVQIAVCVRPATPCIVLQTQVEEYIACARICRACLKLQRLRDWRT